MRDVLSMTALIRARLEEDWSNKDLAMKRNKGEVCDNKWDDIFVWLSDYSVRVWEMGYDDGQDHLNMNED